MIKIVIVLTIKNKVCVFTRHKPPVLKTTINSEDILLIVYLRGQGFTRMNTCAEVTKNAVMNLKMNVRGA
jgi:hypothetical protein